MPLPLHWPRSILQHERPLLPPPRGRQRHPGRHTRGCCQLAGAKAGCKAFPHTTCYKTQAQPTIQPFQRNLPTFPQKAEGGSGRHELFLRPADSPRPSHLHYCQAAGRTTRLAAICMYPHPSALITGCFASIRSAPGPVHFWRRATPQAETDKVRKVKFNT